VLKLAFDWFLSTKRRLAKVMLSMCHKRSSNTDCATVLTTVRVYLEVLRRTLQKGCEDACKGCEDACNSRTIALDGSGRREGEPIGAMRTQVVFSKVVDALGQLRMYVIIILDIKEKSEISDFRLVELLKDPLPQPR
jgi:hypothetical protein